MLPHVVNAELFLHPSDVAPASESLNSLYPSLHLCNSRTIGRVSHDAWRHEPLHCYSFLDPGNDVVAGPALVVSQVISRLTTATVPVCSRAMASSGQYCTLVYRVAVSVWPAHMAQLSNYD